MLPRDFRNMGVLTGVEALWGFQASLTSSATVLTVYLLQHGASKAMIGSISAVEAAAFIIPQAIALYIFTSTKGRRRQLFVWHMLLIIPWIFGAGLFILLCGGFANLAKAWIVLVLYALYCCGIGTVGAAWVDWVANVFEKGVRGMAMGLSWGFSAIAGTVGGLLAGRLIEKADGDAVFGWLYLAAGVLATLSVLSFYLIKDPKASEPDAKPDMDFMELQRKFAASLSLPNFKSFLVGRMLATAGFCVTPFIAVNYLSPAGGGLSDGVIVSCGAAMTAGSALGNLVLGGLGDKKGHRLGIVIGIAMQIASLLAMLFSAGLASCLAAYFAAGLCVAASMISHSNMVIEMCPHDHRLAHITVGALVMSPAAILLPLLAGYLATWPSIGLRGVLGMSLAFSVVSLAWMIWRVKDPRHVAIAPSAEDV